MASVRRVAEGADAKSVGAVVVDGDTVAARGRFRGQQDGASVAFAWADFHEFDGDRIARRYTFTDRDEV